MYIFRLDDACEYMDTNKWDRMEKLLNSYNIKPLVGIIPDCKDLSFIDKYSKDEFFWDKVSDWISNGWTPAMHGYQHLYCSKNGGINPYVENSEFAGLSYEEQSFKIKEGYKILKQHNIIPDVFFAPSHTFDLNTLLALKNNTDIRIISDTIATDIYYSDDFFFIPLVSSKVRNIGLPATTFCYHPNTMTDKDFESLECFLEKYSSKFNCVDKIALKKRDYSCLDKFIKKLYFEIRKRRHIK